MAQPDPWMLANVTTEDDYEPETTIADGPAVDVLSLAVTNAAIYYQLERDATWTPEVFLGPWVGSLARTGITGFRCRSAVADHPAQVTARLVTDGAADTGSVPGYTIGTNGVVGAAVILGIVNADGTVRAGSGFTVAKTDIGTYAITFKNALPTPPVVLANPIGSNLRFANANPEPAADGVTIVTTSESATTDCDFNFAVFQTQ